MNQIPKNKKNLADSVSTRFSMVAGGGFEPPTFGL